MSYASGEALARFEADHAVDPEGRFHTALGVLAGAIAIAMSFSPMNWIPLAFVGLIPVLAVTRGASDAVLLRRAFLFGFLINLFGFPWVAQLVSDFGGFPFVVGLLLLFVLCAQQGLVPALAFFLARKIERALGWRHGYALPMTYVAIEFLMPLIFPWRLGHSQVFHLNYLQLAELGGVHLMTFGVVLVNVGLYDVVRVGRARALTSLGSVPRVAWYALAFFVFAQFYGAWRVRAVEASQVGLPTVRIGLIEGDIPIDEKWDTTLFQRNLLAYQKLSVEAVEQGAELLIWPESSYEIGEYRYFSTNGEFVISPTIDRSITRLPQSTAPFGTTGEFGLPKIDRVALQRNFTTPVLVGTTTYRRLGPDEQGVFPPVGRGIPRKILFYNSVLMADSQGSIEGIVDKVVLMPLSETFPGWQFLWGTLGINPFVWLPTMGLFGSGDGPEVIEHKVSSEKSDSGILKIGILNCYEDLMPGFVREMQKTRAPHLMVNMTNDAWFGRDFAPAQHMALAVPRAVEVRTWLLRATNTGVTTFVDASGRVRARTSVYDPEILVHDVPVMTASRTPYVAFGEWVAFGAIGFSLFGLWRRRQQRRASV